MNATTNEPNRTESTTPPASGPHTAPPPAIDRCEVTGTHDSDDLLENLLDELDAGLGVLVDLEVYHREDQTKLVMLYMLRRKAKAASMVYATERVGEIAAPDRERVLETEAEKRDMFVASNQDGRTLRDIVNNMEHHAVWASRMVHELHGNECGDRLVDGLRTHVLALVALTEDVRSLQAYEKVTQ